MITKPIHFPILRRRPKYGNYKRHNEYKSEIREDCLRRCVFCDIHEKEAGGEESMTLDHFRPKSLPEYRHLENDPRNLLYACAPCNNLKGNDWPAYGSDDTISGRSGYIDPFSVNRLDYFTIEKDGSLVPKQDPAAYMIKYLELNRSFLKYVRSKREAIYKSLLQFEEYFNSEIETYKLLLENSSGRDRLLIQRDLNRLSLLRALVGEIDSLSKLI
jgi:hypothetical protein